MENRAPISPKYHGWLMSAGWLAVASRAAAAPEGSTLMEYRVDSYDEADGRVDVLSQYFDFNHQADSGLSIGLRYVVDCVSGATPVGTYSPLDPTIWDFVEIEDERRAGTFTIEQKLGDYALAFEFSRSSESDYTSNAVALRGSREMFDKNTLVTVGLAYADDDVLAAPGTVLLEDQGKQSFDFALGLSQVLNKRTVADFNVSYGHDWGYLSDPYRQISQTATILVDTPIGPFPITDTFNFPENRPDTRGRAAFRAAVRHHVEPLDGGLSAAFRAFTDSEGIVSQTIELEYSQQLGERIILTPFFRFYNQSAADYYYPSLTGTDIMGRDVIDGTPPNYSSDYRVSAFESISYGVGLDLKISERLGVTFKYERYEMTGRTEGTPSIFFPTAQVLSAGLKLTF